MDNPEVKEREEPKPERLDVTSWCEATVDMTFFGLGKVYLVDASPQNVTAWIKSAQKDPLGTEATAHMLAAYIDHAEDPGMPVRNAGVQAWLVWMKGQKQKAIRALTDCISWFQGHMSNDAASVPNS